MFVVLGLCCMTRGSVGRRSVSLQLMFGWTPLGPAWRRPRKRVRRLHYVELVCGTAGQPMEGSRMGQGDHLRGRQF